MSKDSEIKNGPTSEYGTWRVKFRRSERLHNVNSAPDATGGLAHFTKLCGLPAVDVPTVQIICSERTRCEARQDGLNDYKILFQVAGSSVLTQDDRTEMLSTGALGLIDVTRPIVLQPQGEQGRLIGLHFPRQSLIRHLGFEPRGGLCWDANAFPSRLLGRFLLGAIGESATALGSSEFYLQCALYNLVGALFDSSDLSRHLSSNDKLFARLCVIIKRYFSDPDIRPAEVAAEAGISVRYLQKLFALRGTTFGNFLRELRLEHAAQLLRQQSSIKTGLPLSEVARVCGYRDYAHFARNFRTRFGVAPGAARGWIS
jgi:AraC family transcriptional activator of tynA and feaB